MQKTVKPIRTGEEYIESLKGRDLKVYLFGELVKEPVDHPMIRPSIYSSPVLIGFTVFCMSTLQY